MRTRSNLTRTRSVVVATCLMLLMATGMASLATHVVSTMRDSANAMDDQRAVQAAESALMSLKKRLASVVKDNAVWDDAYEATAGEGALAWIEENWGSTSSDYPLYDGVVITDETGKVFSAFWKGQPFDPREGLGPTYGEQIAYTKLRADLTLNFAETDYGIALFGSNRIRPFAAQPEETGYKVLTFVKLLTEDTVNEMRIDYQLPGLTLSMTKEPSVLHVPLKTLSGGTVAYLSWPTGAPGTKVFHQVYPYLVAGALVLLVFMITVLAFGGLEARRLRALAAQAHEQATHDSLTGLYNRFGVTEELARQLTLRNARKPLSLHLLDLDGFKPVNDAWGHALGDELLRLVADMLSKAHHEIIAVARIGGDEFALIQVGASDPAAVADTILRTFKEPFMIDGRTIEVGGSIGIAGEDSLADPHELLRRADMALYRAKDDGRGRAVAFDPGLEAERAAAAELEADLRQALRQDAIQVAFQPLVCSRTGTVRGVEALARWNGRTGAIRPDIFIPVAERSGLIDVLGMQILRKSLQATSNWPELSLSVNVSPVQLCNPHFAADVLNVLQEEGFDPRRLTLEITEGVLMSNPDQAKRAIDQLRAKGIRFALDDFGCGYASIGALREFGFDRMKIDRSLVDGLDRDLKDLGVLQATVSLATALDIPVTAEGVETDSQARTLKEAGCDLLQGYLVGRPMPAEELAALLTKKQAA